jgi:osmotically-inducible protein OsmY
MRSALARNALAACAAAGLVFAGGCEWVDLAEKRARLEVKRAADSTARTVEREASKVAQKVSREASETLAEAADSLGTRVENVARDASREVTGALEAAEVKTALVATPGLDASRIDVDVDAKKMTLRLRGAVPTAAMRDRAERIARSHASGYAVRSELAVSPR